MANEKIERQDEEMAVIDAHVEEITHFAEWLEDNFEAEVWPVREDAKFVK